MKAVCMIASDNVVIDGDVIFSKIVGSYFIYVPPKVKNLTIRNTLFTNTHKKLPFGLKLLWFWHMVVLRKSHVYLTGVLR